MYKSVHKTWIFNRGQKRVKFCQRTIDFSKKGHGYFKILRSMTPQGCFIDRENPVMSRDPVHTVFKTDDLVWVHIQCIFLKLTLGQTLLELTESSLNGLYIPGRRTLLLNPSSHSQKTVIQARSLSQLCFQFRKSALTQILRFKTYMKLQKEIIM